MEVRLFLDFAFFLIPGAKKEIITPGMKELLQSVFTPAELRVLFLVSYAFLVIVVSIVLGTGVRYLYFLFRYYPPYLEDVLRKNKEGGVLHEFSYSWFRGVRLKPINRESERKVQF